MPLPSRVLLFVTGWNVDFIWARSSHRSKMLTLSEREVLWNLDYIWAQNTHSSKMMRHQGTRNVSFWVKKATKSIVNISVMQISSCERCRAKKCANKNCERFFREFVLSMVNIWFILFPPYLRIFPPASILNFLEKYL